MEILRIYEKRLRYFRYSENTINCYSKHISDFITFLYNKDYRQISALDFTRYLNQYTFSSTSQQNQIINALKFLYKEVLNRKYDKVSFKRPRKEEKLPEVISETELKIKIESIKNKKHKAIIALTYSVGLRRSDVQNLKTSDINSKSMQIRIKEGKGKKDAYLPLYKNVLHILRDYFKEYRPKEYLFEGQTGGKYSGTSLNKIVKKYFGEKYHFHNLRHSCATHLLNKGVDVTFIQKMLRHKDVKTTMIYLKVTTRDLNNLPQLV